MEELEPTEIVRKVKKVQESAEWTAYTNRMDYDYDLWSQVVVKWDKHEDKGAINVRSNDIKTFVTKLLRTILSAEPDIKVSSPRLNSKLTPIMETEQCDMLERLFYFLLKKGSERLRRSNGTDLMDALAWFGLVRGACYLRTLVYKSGDNVVFDLLPLDPRWTTYARGRDGYSWICHKEFHTPEAIKEDWDKDVGGGSSDLSIPVFDYWCKVKDKVYNLIIEGNGNTNLQEPIEHDMTEIPIVMMPVFSQPRIANEQGMMMKYFADSVFADARVTIDVKDKLLSIGATKAHMMAKAPVVYTYQEGTEKPDDRDLTPGYYPGDIIIKSSNITAEKYPQEDISGFFQNFYGAISSQMQTALLPPIDWGVFGSPPPSGTLAQETKQAWDKALGAVTRALSNCLGDACRMADKQIRDNSFTIPVEYAEKDEFYIYEITPSDLDPRYYIDVKFNPLEPFKQMVNYQLGEMALKLGVSRDTVLERFLQLQDVPAEKRKWAIEKAIEAVPTAVIREGLEALEEQKRTGIANEIRNYLATMGYQNYAKSIEAEQRITGQGPQGQPPSQGER